MKTLLLTSAGMQIQEEIIKILPKPISKTKIAHIVTAVKGEKDTSYVKREKEIMKKIGLRVEDIEIEGKNEKELHALLNSQDVIYVQGGNTFYLLKYVKLSCFDTIVKKLIKKGTIYIGVSAGSYIACPTIEMATWKLPDRNYVRLTDCTALNFVPFLISVHYKPLYKDILKKNIKEARYPVRILTDDQAFLIKDGKITLVGKGKEIML